MPDIPLLTYLPKLQREVAQGKTKLYVLRRHVCEGAVINRDVVEICSYVC